MQHRQLTFTDRIVAVLDEALRTAAGPAPRADRPSPAAEVPESELNESERKLVGQLIRVDHAGEVCAQALYQGQALTARLPTVRQKMEKAAQEENDHLAWTEERLTQLSTHKSYLNPFWYAGSFAIGAVAGVVGDRWSLGFVVETERQVIRHLDSHLQQLPSQDNKSRAILEQMKEDEAHHATTALQAGAATFPRFIQRAMQFTSRIMTMTAARF